MGELARPLKIRPHHLLCMLGFRGLGYSGEFISNMAKLVGKLRSDSTFPIILVVGCDAICVSCPHNKEGKCLKRADSELKAKALDLELLQRIMFKTGIQMPIDEALRMVKERITSEDMVELCRDCEWWELGYCVDGLERLKSPLA